jgi:hypothetical protein
MTVTPSTPPALTSSEPCCERTLLSACCQPQAKAVCCAPSAPAGTCGCQTGTAPKR